MLESMKAIWVGSGFVQHTVTDEKQGGKSYVEKFGARDLFRIIED
jgi:hypothetical protein